MRIYPFEADLNLAAFGGELYCVGNQVPDDLLKASGITGDRVDARINDLLHRDGFGLRRRAHAFRAGLHHLREIDRLNVKAQAATLDARNVEQVFDQLTLYPDRALDGGNASPHRLAQRTIAQQSGGPQQDRVKRIT